MKLWFLKLSLAALVTLSIAACGAPTVRPDAELQPSEGVLVASLDCSNAQTPVWVEVYASGQKSSGYSGSLRKSAVLNCHPRKRELEAVTLPAGRYFIGKIGASNFRDIAESSAISFAIVPGTLTYVGNFPVHSSYVTGQNAKAVFSGPSVDDREPEAKAEVDTRFTSLSSRYPWLKAIARGPGG